jgi:prolyl oligopeptidase
MREGDAGEDIPLVDPANLGQDRALTVGILNISSDGNLLAYSVRRGGEDSCEVAILNVNRRMILPDRLPRGICRGLAFSPDSSGFYYVHVPLTTPHPHFRAVKWHVLGSALDADREVFSVDQDPKRQLWMFASQDGLSLGYGIMSLYDPCTVDIYIHILNDTNTPRRIVEGIEGIFRPVLSRDKLIALTDWRSPNGRIVLIDPDNPQRNAWRDIVPETKARIQNVAVSGGLVFAEVMEGFGTNIRIFDLSGNSCGTLPCPQHGTARLLSSQRDSESLFYSFTSFSHPTTIFHYNISTGTRKVWAQNQVPFDAGSVEVEQVWHKSKDGTDIPMFLVAQRGRRQSGPLPTFLTGYGGFGLNVTPLFTAYATFLMEQGFLFAVAILRGGSEFGEQWHLAGKRHNRQNAIDDFLAAAEWLVGQGHAAPGRIAIGGGSNAGLLVGAAVTQRPDLFRAVVCVGPLLDMIRYHLFDCAEFFVDEYGSPENENDFRRLHAYSPYHHVEEKTSYPSILLVSGDADSRCNPMHARKMTARLQAATNSGRPVLLDYKPAWGHVPVQPLSKRIAALTDRLAFICHELGVSV